MERWNGYGYTSVSAAQKSNSKATKHVLGEYDGTEKFVLTSAAITTKWPNRKYCHTPSSTVDNGWCRKDWDTANKAWPTSAQSIVGNFIPGSLSGNSNAERMNMMPFSAVTYIIKT